MKRHCTHPDRRWAGRTPSRGGVGRHLWDGTQLPALFLSTVLLALLCGLSLAASAPAARSPAVAKLAAEVQSKGWIAYGARSDDGDWDLFLSRPDGSGIQPLTRTPEWNEFSPQISRDGRRLLYRRIPRDETIDNNHHGTQGELVVARSDGQGPVVLGKPGDYPWASWNPEATRISCLSLKGITLVDVASRQVVRSFPRQGFSNSWSGPQTDNGWRAWPTPMVPAGASPGCM